MEGILNKMQDTWREASVHHGGNQLGSISGVPVGASGSES